MAFDRHSSLLEDLVGKLPPWAQRVASAVAWTLAACVGLRLVSLTLRAIVREWS